ncbi:MAG: PIN domain-containing protein [Synergistaceae bacterium]|jgi:predicted nucleic acid-binding protein|nr:PIN domain-containing protein [Synergistaceae bacterium]
MTIFALDTNIVSYLLKDDETVFNHYFEEIAKGNDFIIPPITYYEIKRGLFACNAVAKIAAFNRMCQEFGIGEMNIAIWDEAARLFATNRKTGLVMDDADLFIAVFCLVGGYTLVTNNIRHFERVKGLTLVNWK